MQRSAMRRCLKGLGGFPTSTDGFILGPSHGTVGRLDLFPATEHLFFRLTFWCAFLILIPWAIFWSDLQKGESCAQLGLLVLRACFWRPERLRCSTHFRWTRAGCISDGITSLLHWFRNKYLRFCIQLNCVSPISAFRAVFFADVWLPRFSGSAARLVD